VSRASESDSIDDDRGECPERSGQSRSQIGETHQPVEVHDILSERCHLGECVFSIISGVP